MLIAVMKVAVSYPVMKVVGFNQYLSFVCLSFIFRFMSLNFQNCRFMYLLQKLIFRKTFVIKI